MTWPDSFYVDYDYDLTNAVTGIRENGASSGAGVLATFAYDDLGRRTSLTRGNGVVTSYAFDAASRLATLTQNLSGTGDDLTRTFDYNAGAQIVERGASNAAYNTPTPNNGTTSYVDNGLNQYTAISQAQPTYDARGNMTRVGLSTFSYDIFNRLTSATPAGASQATFAYDALGRLRESVASSTTTRFLYDGVQAIGEFNGSNVMQRRYVFGPGINEPLVWYEGSGTSDRRWLVGDERGSVVAVTNSSGAATNINAYDEYGVPASTNSGTFQYTGQMWLPGAQLYNYRARAYSAELGRFMQTDPVGFSGGMNLYAYVSGDPINFIDPNGLCRNFEVRDERRIYVYREIPGGQYAVDVYIEDIISRYEICDGVVTPLGGGDGRGRRGGVTPMGDPTAELPPLDELPYPDRARCEDLQQQYREEQFRGALAERGANRIQAWWFGVELGLFGGGGRVGAGIGAAAGGLYAVNPETAARAGGAANYNDVRDQAIARLGAIRAEMAHAGCFSN